MSTEDTQEKLIKPGDRIYHYFAGYGRVDHLVSNTTAYVHWADDSSGIAYIRHLEHEKAPASGQEEQR